MLEERLKCYIGKRNAITAFILFVIGYVAHIGIWLFKLGTYDANCSGMFHYTPDWEASLGRWMIKPIDAFNNYLAVPTFTGAIAVAIFALSTTMVLVLMEIDDIIARIILGALFILTPCVCVTLSSFYCAIDYSLALLFSATFVYYCKKKCSLYNIIIACIALVMSLAIYQAYIGTSAALCLSLLVLMLIKGENIIDVIKKGLYMLGIAIVSTLLYHCIARLVVYAKGLEMNSYGGANRLLETSFLDIKIAISIAYQTFKSSLMGYCGIVDSQFYRGKYYMMTAIAITFVLLLCIIIIRKYYHEPIRLVLIAMLLLVFPLASGIVMFITKGHSMTYLMSQGIYVFIILCGSIVMYSNPKIQYKPIYNVGMAFWVAIALFTYELFAINNGTYEYFHIRHNSAIATGNRALAIAEMLPEYKSETEFCFAGAFNNDYPVDTYLEKISLEKYCEWGCDNYTFNKAIIENLYREDIGSSIKLCDDATYTKIVASDEFMMMPVYPCYGSIKIIDEVCIVKLEENPPLPSSN